MTKRLYPNQKGKIGHRLTDRQDRFCREYIITLNASDAARKAGYSKASTSRAGIDLLGKPHIASRIAELQAARNRRVQVDADYVLQPLLQEVEAKAGDIFAPDGTLLPVKQWPLIWQQGLVSQVTVTQLYEREAGTGRNVAIGEMKSVIFADRAKRLELLGRHISVGAFKDRVGLGIDNPLADVVPPDQRERELSGERGRQGDRAPAR